jgi:4-hydroxy-2-oxoheptanedioate aldolase
MLDYTAIVTMLQAAALTDTFTLVRVPSEEPSSIMKVLDAGAGGVVVPLVNTAEQAARAVDACRYPPDGSRSWGPTRAQLRWADYTTVSVNERVVCAVQIETLEAVDNLEEILSVPGVDIALVGPSDLAVSMGMQPGRGPVAGQHAETIAHIAARADAHGVLPAIYCGSVEAGRGFHALGYRMLAIAGDVLLLRDGAVAAVRDFRAQPSVLE